MNLMNGPNQKANTAWLFVSLLLVVLYFVFEYLATSNFHNPFILFTVNSTINLSPLHREIPLLGYSYVLPHGILHKENYPFYRHAYMYLTGLPYPDYYMVRIYYGFLASLLVPFLSYVASFSVLNSVIWLMALWLIFITAREFLQDTNFALLGMLLGLFSLGYVYHYHDFSAHSLSFLTYYIGAILLWRSDLYRHRLAFRQHLALLIYFVFAALCYNTGIMLVALYVLLGWRHNRWWHLLLVMLVTLLVQRWTLWVHLLVSAFPDIYADEGGQLGQSLHAWLLQWQQHSLFGFIATGFYQFITFLMFEPIYLLATLLLSPLIFKTLSKKQMGFLLWVIVAPVICCLPYAYIASARSYMVYGASLGLFVLLAAGFYGLFKVNRRVFFIVLPLMFIIQIVYTNLFLFGYYGSAQFYMFSHVSEYFHHPVLWFTHFPVMSISSNLHGWPQLFSQQVMDLPTHRVYLSWNKYAAYLQSHHLSLSMVKALAAFAFFFVRAFLLWVLMIAIRQAVLLYRQVDPQQLKLTLKKCCVLALISLSVSAFYAVLTRFNFVKRNIGLPPVHYVGQAKAPKPYRQLTLKMTIAPRLHRALQQFSLQNHLARIYFLFGEAQQAQQKIEVLVNGQRIETLQGRDFDASYRLPLAALQKAKTLTLKLSSNKVLKSYSGWQKFNLPGRHLSLNGQPVHASNHYATPLVEIRIARRADKAYVLYAI